MDETTHRISGKKLTVNFDLRDQENCFISLTFTYNDVLNILNMDTFSKKNIDVKGIGGTASLPPKGTAERNICFNYQNKNETNAGTVFYPYEKMIVLLDQAFTQLNSKKR